MWFERTKTKRRVALALSLLLFSLLAIGFVKASRWYDSHTVSFQVPWRSPVIIAPRQITATTSQPIAYAKPLTDKDAILSLPNGVMVWNIYGLESSYGNPKLDSCRASGMYNGFGYGVTATTQHCYQSLAEVSALVDTWLTEHKSMGISNELCYYNTGNNIRNCDYYQKYLKLK